MSDALRPARPQELPLLPEGHLPALRSADARAPLLLRALRPRRRTTRRLAPRPGRPRHARSGPPGRRRRGAGGRRAGPAGPAHGAGARRPERLLAPCAASPRSPDGPPRNHRRRRERLPARGNRLRRDRGLPVRGLAPARLVAGRERAVSVRRHPRTGSLSRRRDAALLSARVRADARLRRPLRSPLPRLPPPRRPSRSRPQLRLPRGPRRFASRSRHPSGPPRPHRRSLPAAPPRPI